MDLGPKIGERIKEIRGAISQAAFSAKLNVGQSTIGRYEKGGRSPDAEFILLLKKHYKVNPNWLITGEGSKFIQNGINETCLRIDQESESENKGKYATENLSQTGETSPGKITELITKTIEILESNTVYSGALSANIDAFHEATRTEKQLRDLKISVEHRFNMMDQRIAVLESENKRLKDMMDESPDNGGDLASGQN